MSQKRSMINVREETREKLAAICIAFRWTFSEAVDACCDEFIQQNEMKMARTASIDSPGRDSDQAGLVPTEG